MLATGRLELSGQRAAAAAAPGDARHRRRDLHRLRGRSGRAARAPRGCALGRAVARLHAAGRHLLRHRAHAGAEVREQIAIGAGDVVKRALPLRWRTSSSPPRSTARPSPDSMPLTFRVVRLDGEPREVVRTIAQEPDLDLSAGRYRIEAALGATNVIAATEIALAAGQAQKITLKLEAGSVTLKRADAQAATRATCSGRCGTTSSAPFCARSQPQPTALLAPGRYVVSSETPEQPLRSAIEVKAGEHRTFDFWRLSVQSRRCSHISTNLVPRAASRITGERTASGRTVMASNLDHRALARRLRRPLSALVLALALAARRTPRRRAQDPMQWNAGTQLRGAFPPEHRPRQPPRPRRRGRRCPPTPPSFRALRAPKRARADDVRRSISSRC